MSDLAKRAENGKKGEARTEAVLLDEFWVLRRSVDVDGADFLLQIPADSLEELDARQRRIEPLGVVQAKFFEGKNEVRVQRDYVIRDGGTRNGFFVFIHTDGEQGQHVHYFFTAAEILKEFHERDGFMVFAITDNRTYASYRNRGNQEILRIIQNGMRSTEEKLNREFINWIRTRVRPGRLKILDGKCCNGTFDAMLQRYDVDKGKWVDVHRVWVKDLSGAKILPVDIAISVTDVDIEPSDLYRFSTKDMTK